MLQARKLWAKSVWISPSSNSWELGERQLSGKAAVWAPKGRRAKQKKKTGLRYYRQGKRYVPGGQGGPGFGFGKNEKIGNYSKVGFRKFKPVNVKKVLRAGES